MNIPMLFDILQVRRIELIQVNLDLGLGDLYLDSLPLISPIDLLRKHTDCGSLDFDVKKHWSQ